jgi:tight adherence protein B
MLLIAFALMLVVADLVGVLRVRPRTSDIDEVQILSAIAAGLRVGASLRTAIADATGDSGSPLDAVRHLAVTGAPIGAVARALEGLPFSGPRVAAAVRVAAAAGGRSADVFGRLSDRVVEEAELRRERRILTTQVRMSALIIGGLPVLALVTGGVGRIVALIASGPGGAAVAATGLGMQALGILLVWRMAAG